MTQRNQTWTLAKTGSVDENTSTVTWQVAATQTAPGAKRLLVAGKMKIKNSGVAAAPVGNIVVNLQAKNGSTWSTVSSNVHNQTAGDAATSAKVVQKVDNDNDGDSDEGGGGSGSGVVITINENGASGALQLFNASTLSPLSLSSFSLAPGASITLGFVAEYNNSVLNLPNGRKIRVEPIVSFGNSGTGWGTAANVDIDGSGAVEADEARVGSAWIRFGEKTVPSLTSGAGPAQLKDTASDISTTGTVTFSNPVFNLGSTSGTVKVTYNAGGSGGTITNCAHLIGLGVTLTDCDTQAIPAPGWQPGDMTTYTQVTWDTNSTAASLLQSSFNDVYPVALDVGILGTGGHSITFTSASAVLAYIPTSGFPAPLTGDVVNPISTPSGIFGADVVALQLNVDFFDAGVLTGTATFGDLRVCGVANFDGQTVRQVLATANTLLGGGTAAVTIDQIVPVVQDLNSSFDGGTPSMFADDHLVAGACP